LSVTPQNRAVKKTAYKIVCVAGLVFTCVLAYICLDVTASSDRSGQADRVGTIDAYATALPRLGVTSSISSPTALRSTALSPANQNAFTKMREHARAVRNCVRLLDNKRLAEELLQIATSDFTTEQRAFQENQLKDVNAALAELSSGGACVGLDESKVRDQEYSALKDAAIAGDWDAASCYVMAPFAATDEQLTDANIDSYRELARNFIVAGMRRGDWRFVTIAQLSVGDGGMRHPRQFQRNLFYRLRTPDKKMYYGYTRLQRLGATGDYANQLDTQLDAIAVELSENDLQEMNRWAEEEYRINFSGQQKNQESPDLCNLH
jgi:hypothetical protein